MRLGDEDIFFNIELSDNNKKVPVHTKNLLIPNNQGRLIRLKNIAKIELVEGSPNYNHFNGKRSTAIYGDIDKKSLQVPK